jgi:hypothetical protein
VSYNRYKTNEYIPKHANKLYKIGHIKVYAPSMVEARRRMLRYFGTQLLRVEKKCV